MENTEKRLIWDLPTRIFHWALVISVLAAWVFAKTSDEKSPLFFLHIAFGVSAALLLAWRILWGLIGSKHARFQSLLFAPTQLISYFKSVISGKGEYHAGHNPAGSLVIWALLGLIFLAVASGPLMSLGGGEIFEEIHEISTNLLIFVIAFHVAGVLLATRMNKENYVRAMFSGMKRARATDAIPHSSRLAALALLVYFGAGLAYFLSGYDLNTGVFRAPGTAFEVRFGEEEHEGGHEDGHDHENH